MVQSCHGTRQASSPIQQCTPTHLATESTANTTNDCCAAAVLVFAKSCQRQGDVAREGFQLLTPDFCRSCMSWTGECFSPTLPP